VNSSLQSDESSLEGSKLRMRPLALYFPIDAGSGIAIVAGGLRREFYTESLPAGIPIEFPGSSPQCQEKT
jgi:hypothetical protein